MNKNENDALYIYKTVVDLGEKKELRAKLSNIRGNGYPNILEILTGSRWTVTKRISLKSAFAKK